MRLRVVLPLAIRDAGKLFNAQDLKPVRYIGLDWPRRAQMLGLPHAWPDLDPVVQEFPSMRVSDDQPYIFRLSKLGTEAQRLDRGIDFAGSVSRLLFGAVRL